MNISFAKMKKALASLCAIILAFGLVSSFTNTVSAETNQIKPILNKQEGILPQLEVVKIEDKIENYLDEIPYSEEEFEAMSDEEFEIVYNTYFKSEEFLSLENELGEVLDKEVLDNTQGEFRPYVLPILVPIATAVARVALQTVVKQGTKVATKYLKDNLKNIGDDYIVKWNTLNSQNELTTLLMIQDKSSKQPIFRLDIGSLHSHLTPGTSTWYWHFHIGATKEAMKQHYSLRSLIPSKYKPKSSLTLF